MNGVILYADDDVLNNGTYENNLFQKFNRSLDYSILPITNISDLEKTISSISTFRALLLDWTFKRPSEDEEMPEMNENPLDVLRSKKIYSLVYIYSREELANELQEELKGIFGTEKIYFEKKASDFDEDQEFAKICREIASFEEKNKHMEIPFIWSQSINQSVQTIFSELEQADPNWIKEVKETAENDSADPVSEVINVFHNILNESLIQHKLLRNELKNYVPLQANVTEENTAKLYNRIFYSHLSKDAPVMTGDIFKFNDTEYGILITPECEVENRKDIQLEFLVFSKDGFEEFLEKNHSHNRKQNVFLQLKDKKKEALKKIFNNDKLSTHLLPSFPFEEHQYDMTARIDFKNAFTVKSKNDFENCRSSYKLNAPYINQLRQRYISFFGRYGVPAIPDSLRTYNLK